MEGFLLRAPEDGAPRRCRKHATAQSRNGGVCPECVRAHLLRLCPDCARERSHGCSCPSTSSDTSSAASFSLSASYGAPGPVGGEAALRRSVFAAPSRRPPARFDDAAGAEPARSQGRGGGGWSWLWSLGWGKKAEKEKSLATWLPRSSSAGVAPTRRERGGCGSGRWKKGWGRYLSTISAKSFRRTSKVVQAKSPSVVTEENLQQLHT